MIESSQTVLSKYQSLKDLTHSKTSESFFFRSKFHTAVWHYDMRLIIFYCIYKVTFAIYEMF